MKVIRHHYNTFCGITEGALQKKGGAGELGPTLIRSTRDSLRQGTGAPRSLQTLRVIPLRMPPLRTMAKRKQRPKRGLDTAQ